jgi:hypothetical protein
VSEAVTGNLMPGTNDTLDQVRKSLGDRTYSKEGSNTASLRKNLKDEFRAVFHAALV